MTAANSRRLPDGSVAVGREAAIERFRALLRFPTISSRIAEDGINSAFTRLFEWIATAYPNTFETGVVRAVPPWRLVIDIPGSDKALDPVLLVAHYDVVDATPSGWTHRPFDAAIADGFIWARGALDDKNVVAAMMEAVERLLGGGARLRRGVVIALGGDEELAGDRGARATAQEMRSAGRRFHCVIDEGSIIATGMLATPPQPIALVGVAEKGALNVRIRATAGGGHASMPPPHTAVGDIARAIAAIERSPFPPRLLPTVRAFFCAIAPHASPPTRFVYAHAALFWPLLRRALARGSATNALIRTTQAATTMTASDAVNVLPRYAEAGVNVRILPGDSVASVVDRYRTLLHGVGVEIDTIAEFGVTEPVDASPTDHPAYRSMAEAVRTVFPGTIVAPFLVTASTDSKWFADLTDAIYRFVPMVLSTGDLSRIHGTDERFGVDAFFDMIDFYTGFLRRECLDA